MITAKVLQLIIILPTLASLHPLVNAFQSTSIPSISLRSTLGRTQFSSSGAAVLLGKSRFLHRTQQSQDLSKKLQTWSNDDLEGPDRIKACIPYVLPLLDGDFFGKYIYQRIPPLDTLDQLLLAPLVTILQSFPFISLVLFCLLSIGTRNVDGMSRNVRFNAQQAVLIDIALILPTIIAEGLEDVEVPRIWAEMGSNFVWYFYMSCIIYSVTMNLRGRKPSGLPFLSDAAEIMTGPF